MSYMTFQRKALIKALEQHHDELLSADEIISFIGESMSRSAVYRNLSFLEKQGLIKKTAVNDSNRVLYRYTGSEECRNLLHLECSKCGRTCHLKANATSTLIKDVLQDAEFEIDSSSTVLYGVCSECRKD